MKYNYNKLFDGPQSTESLAIRIKLFGENEDIAVFGRSQRNFRSISWGKKIYKNETGKLTDSIYW